MSQGPDSVLVVDDDDDVRTAMVSALEAEGIAAISAADGEEALSLLHQGARPCAVFLDWRMPRLDGEGFLAARASSQAFSDIPVFVISASFLAGTDPRVQGFFSKPLQLDDLLASVRRVCSLQCPADSRASCPRRVAAPG